MCVSVSEKKTARVRTSGILKAESIAPYHSNSKTISATKKSHRLRLWKKRRVKSKTKHLYTHTIHEEALLPSFTHSHRHTILFRLD